MVVLGLLDNLAGLPATAQSTPVSTKSFAPLASPRMVRSWYRERTGLWSAPPTGVLIGRLGRLSVNSTFQTLVDALLQRNHGPYDLEDDAVTWLVGAGDAGASHVG